MGIMSKQNILFITWDGDKTTYAESLFMPIYALIQEKDKSIQFHYLQFTWAKDTLAQESASKKYNIPYKKVTIHRKPIQSVGGFYTLLKGSTAIQKYVREHNINILMPRSTFPAYMVLKSKLNLPIIFDADGLPIEERIEFAGLRKGSKLHQFLSNIERKMVNKANVVLTRSKKAIAYHVKKHQVKNKEKFFVVSNGRDAQKFTINTKERERVRKELEINSSTLVFIYVGSFGGKYGFNEMLQVFKTYLKKNNDIRFLYLTGSPEEVISNIPKGLRSYFHVMCVCFNEVPAYLNAGDIAFSIIKPTFSMQAVVPIKLGEYLLTGLPTIASKGIGDTESIVEKIPSVSLFNHKDPDIDKALTFIQNSNKFDRLKTRKSALKHFTLEVSANSYLYGLERLNNEG